MQAECLFGVVCCCARHEAPNSASVCLCLAGMGPGPDHHPSGRHPARHVRLRGVLLVLRHQPDHFRYAAAALQWCHHSLESLKVLPPSLGTCHRQLCVSLRITRVVSVTFKPGWQNCILVAFQMQLPTRALCCVGYGDLVPGTRASYLVSTVEQCVGILLSSLLLGIVVSRGSPCLRYSTAEAAPPEPSSRQNALTKSFVEPFSAPACPCATSQRKHTRTGHNLHAPLLSQSCPRRERMATSARQPGHARVCLQPASQQPSWSLPRLLW